MPRMARGEEWTTVSDELTLREEVARHAKKIYYHCYYVYLGAACHVTVFMCIVRH